MVALGVTDAGEKHTERSDTTRTAIGIPTSPYTSAESVILRIRWEK